MLELKKISQSVKTKFHLQAQLSFRPIFLLCRREFFLPGVFEPRRGTPINLIFSSTLLFWSVADGGYTGHGLQGVMSDFTSSSVSSLRMKLFSIGVRQSDCFGTEKHCTGLRFTARLKSLSSSRKSSSISCSGEAE